MTEDSPHFGRRLADQMHRFGPLCVGIDPSGRGLARWGLDDDAAGLRAFADTLVEAAAGLAGVVKPQAAFFERHGWRGIKVLEEVCQRARERGLLVLLDAKRGDIGNTNAAYAEAYLRPDSPVAVDAITVTPYLGFGSLGPLIDTALANGTGLFVLTRTSNPEGRDVQTAQGGDGSDVAAGVIARITEVNAHAGPPMGSIGLVFGATVGTAGYDLAIAHGPILAPGLGAQGATPADLAREFGAVPGRVLASASRALAAAGPDIGKIRHSIAVLTAECREALCP